MPTSVFDHVTFLNFDFLFCHNLWKKQSSYLLTEITFLPHLLEEIFFICSALPQMQSMSYLNKRKMSAENGGSFK